MLSRKFVSLFLAGVAVFSLNACETFDKTFNKPQAEDGKLEVVSYYDPRYYGSNYDQVATEMSNDDITVYGYGGGPVAGDMPAPGTSPDARPYRAPKANVQNVRGIAMSDPSVTVYPFDDGAYQPQEPISRLYGGDPRPVSKQAAAGSDTWGTQSTIMPPMSHAADSYGASRPTLQPVQPADARVPSRVYFAHDSKSVTPAGKEVLNHIARSYQGGNISVEGHASSRAEQPNTVERKITNLKVSMERAFNVSRTLMKDGVPAAAIETKAYGDTRPPLVGVGMDLESASRRVEIRSE